MQNPSIWATPRKVTETSRCYFYHTVDIPGHGEFRGVYDLRKGASEYLGGVSFKGKRVLEVGVASGFLSGFMESQGAEVVGLDVSKDFPVDVVPFAADDFAKEVEQGREFVDRINNGYWLYHQAKGLQARMVYASAYAIPAEIGMVDIATFGDVLLHLRDPFLALQNAARLTRETLIVAEPFWRFSLLQRILYSVADRLGLRFMIFAPNFRTRLPNNYTWWILPPQVIREFLGVLGFEKIRIVFHKQRAFIKDIEGSIPHYTIVAERTRPLSNVSTRSEGSPGEWGRISTFVEK